MLILNRLIDPSHCLSQYLFISIIFLLLLLLGEEKMMQRIEIILIIHSCPRRHLVAQAPLMPHNFNFQPCSHPLLCRTSTPLFSSHPVKTSTTTVIHPLCLYVSVSLFDDIYRPVSLIMTLVDAISTAIASRDAIISSLTALRQSLTETTVGVKSHDCMHAYILACLSYFMIDWI